MKTLLRAGSRVLLLLPSLDRGASDEPIALRDAPSAEALLRGFPGEPNTAALRALLAREPDGLVVHRLEDAEVVTAVAWRLSTGRLCAVHVPVASPVPVASLGGMPGEAIEPLPPSPPLEERAPPKTWIEIQLMDMEDGPIAGARYAITLPDGEISTGRLDSKGWARVDGVDPGTCSIGFPDFDEEAWRPA